MNIENILLPLSGALHEDTLMYAKNLAIQNDAKLFVVYITNPLAFTNTYSYPSFLYSISNLSMDSIDLVNQSISKKLSSMLDDCNYELIFLVGSTLDLVYSVYKEKSIDFIILPPKDNYFTTNFSNKLGKLSKKVNVPIMVYDNKANV